MDAERRLNNKEMVIIRAEESGVTISAVTYDNHEVEPPVRLDQGEIYIMLINHAVRGYKLRGNLKLLTSLGQVEGDSNLIVESSSVDP